jgi:hypothetical protein
VKSWYLWRIKSTGEVGVEVQMGPTWVTVRLPGPKGWPFPQDVTLGLRDVERVAAEVGMPDGEDAKW